MIFPPTGLAKTTMLLMPFTSASGIATTSSPLGPLSTATAIGTPVLPPFPTTTSPGAISMPMPKISLNVGHGPVVFSPTTTVFAPTSTPTVAKRATDLSSGAPSRQIWYSNEPRPERTFHLHAPGEVEEGRHAFEGIDIDSMYNTDCHGSGNYLYFTITYANGTLARDAEGRPGLFSFGTRWYATYKKVLRKAIFDDSVPHNDEPQCKSGHCFSEVLPGIQYHNEPIRLKRANPELLRTGWKGAMCRYDNKVRRIEKKSVDLGSIGYYIDGANIPPAIIDFVEERVRTTYPTLEITLIVWLTVFLIPTVLILLVFVFIMMKLAKWLYTGMPRLYASIRRGHTAMWEVIIAALEKLHAASKRELDRTENALEKSENKQPTTSAQQTTHQQSVTYEQSPAYQHPTASELSTMYELPDWPVAPPRYHMQCGGPGFDAV